jgi:hypothetical protein
MAFSQAGLHVNEPPWAKLQQIPTRTQQPSHPACSPAKRDGSASTLNDGNEASSELPQQSHGSKLSSRGVSPLRQVALIPHPGLVLVPHGMDRVSGAEQQVQAGNRNDLVARARDVRGGNEERTVDRSPARRLAASNTAVTRGRTASAPRRAGRDRSRTPAPCEASPSEARSPSAAPSAPAAPSTRLVTVPPLMLAQLRAQTRLLERSPSQERLAMYEEDLPSQQLHAHRLHSGTPQAAGLPFTAEAPAPDQQHVSHAGYVASHVSTGRTGLDVKPYRQALSIRSPRLQGLQVESVFGDPRASARNAAHASASVGSARQSAAVIGAATRVKPHEEDGSNAIRAETFTPGTMSNSVAALQRLNNAAAEEHTLGALYGALLSPKPLLSPKQTMFGVEPLAVQQPDPRYQQQRQMMQHHFQKLQQQFEYGIWASQAQEQQQQAPQPLQQPSTSHDHIHSMPRPHQPPHQRQHLHQPKPGLINFDQYAHTHTYTQYSDSGPIDSRHAPAQHLHSPQHPHEVAQRCCIRESHATMCARMKQEIAPVHRLLSALH